MFNVRPHGSNYSFGEVASVNNPRSSFNRSHNYKTTLNADFVIPIFCDEVLPGDTFKVDVASVVRFATLLHPLMSNVYIDFHHFFVPNRLVWNNFQKFCGEQIDPGDSTDYLIPTIEAPQGGFAVGSIYDYLGIPTGVAGIKINALPLRAYNLIWNEWYRDQNLQDSLAVNKGDGPDLYSAYELKRRNKKHDYFTSCLPWLQKGPEVDLPIGVSAPVVSNGQAPTFTSTSGGATNRSLYFATNTLVGFTGSVPGVNSVVDKFGSESGLIADLSDATAATINELREAITLQQFFERDARGGTRYTEILRSHFGVISPDARLQRPEYLGGSSNPFYTNVVPNATGGDVPQATLAGWSMSSFSDRGFFKSFVEHGYVFTFATIRADLNYQQGLHRMWSRQTRYDFYWPSFAHLGEQAVLSKEIYCDGSADDDDVFGYQERYAEYRFKPSITTGKFRSSDPQTLDSWHLDQDFANRPVLNSEFIEYDTPISRVIATPGEPEFLMDAMIMCHTIRPIPVRGTPGLLRL